jgi:hypothetical protein
VSRASYIDPDVIDHFENGETIPATVRGQATEAAVRDLLDS